MNHLEQILLEGAETLGVSLQAAQIHQLLEFSTLLRDWNGRMNLTGITDEQEVVTKHFLDALTLAQVVVPEGRLIDVGTGAGLPGLPLAIAHPTVQVTLLDSLQKRIRFLEHVVGELGLTNIQCIVGRAEEIGQDPEHRAQYDIVIARAVAQLSVLSEYCLPFAQVGGVVVAMKGTDVADEINQATAALKVLGGVIEQDMVVTLPRTTITHRLIVIRKIAPTPDRYPRRPGKARKAPLG